MEPIQHSKKTTPIDLGALLDACDDAMVTVMAGNTRLVAHRAVLMDRSPVFAAMFAHDMMEASSGQVTITDVEGPVVRQLLSYLYTLQAPQLPNMVAQLLAAGDKYGVSSLKVACEQQLATQLPVETAAATPVDLGALLDACDDAVVTLMAGDTRLAAHRAVLMDRSPVFAAMFAHDTLEASSGQVIITDVDGPVLRQLLSYLYTLRSPQLPDIASQLLAAADKYGVSGMKAACEQQLAAQLSVETAAATAVLAIRHSCESLRQASITFVKAHKHQVMATQGWAEAVHNQPQDVLEVRRLVEIWSLPAEEKNKRLIQAAKEGAVGELEALLAAGANVVARDLGTLTALHWAASEGHVEVARRLITWGAPVDASEILQMTPLHMAVEKGHVAVVRLLLAASANPSARAGGSTPLHKAAAKGHAEVAAALLEAGADRGARHLGRTPLDLARRFNHQQLVELLTRT